MADHRPHRDEDSARSRKWREQFLVYKCSVRWRYALADEALHFRIGGLNIAEVSAMSIARFSEWIADIEKYFSPKERKIAQEIVKEIRERLRFLVEVGAGLSLPGPFVAFAVGRREASASAWRLQIGLEVGARALYSRRAFHRSAPARQRAVDPQPASAMRAIRSSWSSTTRDMMRAADYIVDVGPLAGRKGGRIVAAGSFDDILHANSITADYSTGRRRIEIPEKTASRQRQESYYKRHGAINRRMSMSSSPLGKLICVTGVSGSGKSTLVNETLRPILSKLLYRSYDQPLDYDSVEGTEHIDKLVVVDQAPIGSLAAEQSGDLFERLFRHPQAVRIDARRPDPRVQGGRFSFNVKGSRCEGVPGCRCRLSR